MAARILLIEDQAPILFGMREYFKMRGYAVDAATEREEAMALQGAQPYDLVITDLRLTDLSQTEGLDVIAEIRERYPQTRVILLTAYGTPAVFDEARALGVDHVLLKPIPLEELERTVLEAMGVSR